MIDPTPEAPADTIRRAAALIRKRAEATTQGPWVATALTPHGDPVSFWIESPTIEGACTIAEAQWSLADAEHIASWHPKVALAVAESWEHIAEEMQANDAFVCRPGSRFSSVPAVVSEIYGLRLDWTATITAARIYLGETS